MDKQISEFNENGAIDILRIKNKPNILMLRYEEFVYDFKAIFSGIERFVDIDIPIEIQALIADIYRIESVSETINGKRTFSEYDKITHWHEKHISKYKGKPFYYRDFFQDYQIEYLIDIYKRYLIELGYM